MKKILITSKFFWLFFLYQGASGVTIADQVCRNSLMNGLQPFLHNINNNIEVNILSSEINSGKSCEYPLYLSETNTGLIYYTESKYEINSISSREFFYTSYDSTSATWKKPINIEKEYLKFREAVKIMNLADLFITIDDDIYNVNFKSSTFSPNRLNINTKSIESGPTISPDGNTLYFVSDRKGGYGGKDIWACERLSNGNWSEPYNLGNTINTSSDEESPYLMADGVTLYFSSKGHDSYGGYDIFITTLSYDGLWSMPENIGPPINSTSNDYYYSSDSKGSCAYYSSDKLEKNNQDIYFVKYNSFTK